MPAANAGDPAINELTAMIATAMTRRIFAPLRSVGTRADELRRSDRGSCTSLRSVSGPSALLRAYGGMGSLVDPQISDEMSRLRTRIYEDASALLGDLQR